MRFGLGRVGTDRSAAGHNDASGRLGASHGSAGHYRPCGRGSGRLRASSGSASDNDPAGRRSGRLGGSGGTACDNHSTRRGSGKVQARRSRAGDNGAFRRSAGGLHASGNDRAAGPDWKPIARTENSAGTVVAAKIVGTTPIIRMRGTDRRGRKDPAGGSKKLRARRGRRMCDIGTGLSNSWSARGGRGGCQHASGQHPKRTRRSEHLFYKINSHITL